MNSWAEMLGSEFLDRNQITRATILGGGDNILDVTG